MNKNRINENRKLKKGSMKKNILMFISVSVLLTIALSACGAQQAQETVTPVVDSIPSGDVIAEGRLE
ncbi:MAG: hypothetical protein KDD72_04265, partial [Anaerolineales bacterium]|nr:hypothetical protein [Anaerolineales bacterium]